MSAKKEDVYKKALEDMGVWQDAFAPVVHSLCTLERETARIRKAWKATAPAGKAPSPLDPHYAVIRTNERDIHNMRDSLGLTPKGLRRLKSSVAPESSAAPDVRGGSQVVSAMIDALKAQASTNSVVQIGPLTDD